MESARRVGCAQAKSENESKKCAIVADILPMNDNQIHFNIATLGAPIGLGRQHNYFRPILLEFHQSIWNDSAGNNINNDSSVLERLRSSYDANALTPIGALKQQTTSANFLEPATKIFSTQPAAEKH